MRCKIYDPLVLASSKPSIPPAEIKSANMIMHIENNTQKKHNRQKTESEIPLIQRPQTRRGSRKVCVSDV